MTPHSNRRRRTGNTQTGKGGPQVSAFYRERHPDGPFTTLITYRCLDANDDLINQAGCDMLALTATVNLSDPTSRRAGALPTCRVAIGTPT